MAAPTRTTAGGIVYDPKVITMTSRSPSKGRKGGKRGKGGKQKGKGKGKKKGKGVGQAPFSAFNNTRVVKVSGPGKGAQPGEGKAKWQP